MTMIEEPDQNGEKDRIKLIRATNRLTVAFLVWAIVVGIVGAANVLIVTSFYSDTKSNGVRLTVIEERQNNIIRRLDRMEDKK